ncbi:hypothetical protein GE061_016892 [Apolygus lucorum]|uniref:DNA mismatch repair protein S5 domain-containing protein n=1 Tax=Apolygus lucorum TaxID=248454 RepID=A0A8S9XK39_APOLU|nr:hypothetical protein GE061_016892 [Apolygus lucorum]
MAVWPQAAPSQRGHHQEAAGHLQSPSVRPMDRSSPPGVPEVAPAQDPVQGTAVRSLSASPQHGYHQEAVGHLQSPSVRPMDCNSPPGILEVAPAQDPVQSTAVRSLAAPPQHGHHQEAAGHLQSPSVRQMDRNSPPDILESDPITYKWVTEFYQRETKGDRERQMKNGKYVVLGISYGTVFFFREPDRPPTHLTDNYEVADDCNMKKHLGILFSLGSPYLDGMNLISGRLIAAGIIQKFEYDELMKNSRIPPNVFTLTKNVNHGVQFNQLSLSAPQFPTTGISVPTRKMGEPDAIKKLDEVVVNRIAAGEVIQRPANALKELLENSLDAKSTNIQVTLKNGGLKLLQIQDNGTGIRKQDMDIVCERFTTSKLTKFEDLTSIATFGFRGEALASISHVAHLTITTKTAAQQCAFRAQYEDGKLKGPPKPCAGNQGTLISVEDLFYNVATRKKVLKNPTEEFVKIADVVGNYAVHNPAVGFILKRQGETTSDIKTNPSSTHVDVIRAVYGEHIARELMEVEFSHEVLKFKMHGYISNVNYSTKKLIFILFINNRLVDSTALRKAIERLLGSNKSRVFYTQAKLPGVNLKSEEAILEKLDSSLSQRKVRDNVLVRTDSSVQKIDKFFHSHGEGKKKEEDEKNINRREVRLTSVLTLKRKIEVESSLALREVISDSTYVGLAEREEILIQHSTSLYMLHAESLKKELFYQLAVFEFGNYGIIKFEKPLPLRQLLEIDLSDSDLSGSSVEDVLDGVIRCLSSKKEMLLDYFSIEIDDQHLRSIPLLLENYIPDLSRLPGYLLRLACDVDWTAEEPCFRGICRETARFFSYCNHYDDYDKYKWNMEHVVYPAMKKQLLPHKKLAEDKSIIDLVSLPSLYKVFERC